MKPHRALQKITLFKEPRHLARSIGLHYSCDTGSGIRRQRAGKGFVYLDVRGERVRDRDVLRRIGALAIPPAWEAVWICVDPDGHLQATGRDARGRKQYRYHPLWHRVSNQTKYTSLLLFGEALPGLRRQVEADLRLPGLAKPRVLATVVRLLETTLIRIGNVEYERANNSVGLTTMKDDHVDVTGSTLHFRFRGKSGVHHEIAVSDRRLSAVVKRCRDLPGYELFQYVGVDGEPCPIGSADVNEYLRAVTGQDFSAKDFRTWGGTVAAARTLNALGPAAAPAEAAKAIVQTVKDVAHLLGNRPATCRKYYIHPAIPQSYERGALFEYFARAGAAAEEPGGLSRDERAVMAVLHDDFMRSGNLPLDKLAETA